ncbi:MAG: DNA polymerase III subunit alpha [Phycisphaerae bacterium]|nr:DNA polymerase III subunit alpha [Phycisphaerae bacterium]
MRATRSVQIAPAYIPLHNRSAYSFGSALTMPGALAEFAAVCGMPAIALTDLSGLYAAVQFQQACQKADIKPIFGAELDVVDDHPVARGGAKHQRGYGRVGVVLLARSLVGYGNLCRLISSQHLREDEIDLDDLCEHARDLICLVGRTIASFDAVARGSRPFSGVACDTSPPPAAGLNEHVGSLREAFGQRLYIELTIHCDDDVAVARRRARLADELGIPVVAACESRCLRRDQSPALKALSSIGTLTLLDQPHPDKPRGAWYVRTPREMHRLFRRRPDAIANTRVIAEQCDVALDLSQSRFPGFDSPDGRTAIQHLRALAVAGCRRRYVDEPPQRGIGGKRPTLTEALERIERELSVIEQVHYAEYFLVFHEIAEYCRREGISFLARGSAADSLVCYALGISHACPFRFDLPFDRFINPERARFSKMADIDLDLPWDQRDQVIRWVYDRWGHDRVAMIGAPNTFHARAAVAELGKVYGLPAHEVHRTTKLLPRAASWGLPETVAGSPETRGNVFMDEEPYRTILRMARDLEGLPRHWAMHPCGLVVSPEPLTDLVPVQRSPKGPLVAQYDMDAIEDLGFVKVDLLGQAGLSVLRDAVVEINRSFSGAACDTNHLTPFGGVACDTDRVARYPAKRGVTKLTRHTRVDLDVDVDYSDAATWEMIARGDARGVHHIESPAMTSLLQQCNCRDIDCLTTVVAIIRPGAANQGKKDAFARRYQGLEPASYVHPSLEPVLERTYGLMVFEEHILQTAVEFAGMNLGRADVLRRALNKQNLPMIAELRSEFYASALLGGRHPREIDTVWSQVEAFRGFMFNKAHSAEYAVEAFQGAWLKRRWPAHYIAAILSNYRGFYAHSPTLPQILYVMEALRLGIGFLPPCVNRSGERFSVEYDSSVFSGAACGTENSALRTANSQTEHTSPATSFAICHLPFAIRHSPFATPPPSGRRPMIRVPVSHINGLSHGFLERYHAERRDGGPFASLTDFVARCRPGEAEAQMLLDSGALDGLGGWSRPAMFWQLRRFVRRAALGSATLWGMDSTETTTAAPIEFTEPDASQIAQREMDLLGFPITVDPLTHLGRDDKGRHIDWRRYVLVDQLNRHLGRRVTVCGLMVADRINATTGGDLMKFVTLADRTGFVEAVLFPNTYQRFGHLTASNPILAATGIVEPFENRNGFTLRVLYISPPAHKTSHTIQRARRSESR